MSEKKLTVAELMARAAQQKGTEDASAPRKRRRRSLEEGGVSVAELTGSLPAVKDKPSDSRHTAQPIDDEDGASRISASELAARRGVAAKVSGPADAEPQQGAHEAPHVSTHAADDDDDAAAAGDVAAAPAAVTDTVAGADSLDHNDSAVDLPPTATGDTISEAPAEAADTPVAEEQKQPEDATVATGTAGQPDTADSAESDAADTSDDTAGTGPSLLEQAAAAAEAERTAAGDSPATPAAATEPADTTDTADTGNIADTAAAEATEAVDAADDTNGTDSAADEDTADAAASADTPPRSSGLTMNVVDEKDPVQLTTGSFPAVSATGTDDTGSDPAQEAAATTGEQPAAQAEQDDEPTPASAAKETESESESDAVAEAMSPDTDDNLPATGEAELDETGAEEETEEDDDEDNKRSTMSIVIMVVVALILAVLIFKGFEILWLSSLNMWVKAILAFAVTLGCVGGVHALRTEKDTLSMGLAALAGLAVTFGPLAVVAS